MFSFFKRKKQELHPERINEEMQQGVQNNFDERKMELEAKYQREMVETRLEEVKQKQVETERRREEEALRKEEKERLLRVEQLKIEKRENEERKKIADVLAGKEIMITDVMKIKWWDKEKEKFIEGKMIIEGFDTKVYLENNLITISLEKNKLYSSKVEATEYSNFVQLISESNTEIFLFSTDYKSLREKDHEGKPIEQAILFNKHFNILNEITERSRSAFSINLKEKMKTINEIEQIDELFLNYLRNTAHDILLSNQGFICFERFLYLNFPIGASLLLINNKEMSFLMNFDDLTEGSEEYFTTDEIIKYYSESFFKLVQVLSKKIQFDSQEDAIYFTWLKLKAVSLEFFSNIVKREFSELVNTDQLTVHQLANLYAKLDTIDINSFGYAGALTYYLMENGKFSNNDNFINCYNEAVENLQAVIKNKEIDAFEQLLIGNKRNTLTITDIDLMDGHEFEQFIGTLFSRMGYSAQVTKGSGDQGIDVIVEKNGKKYGIQAKCYSNAVTNKAIQEVATGLSYYKLDKGIVVTNNYFTNSARELAASNGVILWDRNILKEKINEVLQ
jgi:hypothetical protein